MQIEIFQNNRAVRPTTVWKSLSDMYNYLEETKPILHICKKLAETGDKSLKQNLPAMMPMGNLPQPLSRKGRGETMRRGRWREGGRVLGEGGDAWMGGEDEA